MTTPLPNPFLISDVGGSSRMSIVPSGRQAGETTATVVGDAPAVAVTPGLPPDVFKPNLNRLYLDIIFGGPDDVNADRRPLFLRAPFQPRNAIIERSASRKFIQTLIDIGSR